MNGFARGVLGASILVLVSLGGTARADEDLLARARAFEPTLGAFHSHAHVLDASSIVETMRTATRRAFEHVEQAIRRDVHRCTQGFAADGAGQAVELGVQTDEQGRVLTSWLSGIDQTSATARCVLHSLDRRQFPRGGDMRSFSLSISLLDAR
jgi:hypothetical protein